MEGLGMKSFWLDRPVFVTGATGLLGGWLLKELISLRSDIVCLVRDWTPESELVRAHLVEKAKVVRGDVRDLALLDRILGEYEINTVFHLAAQTTVPVANRNPISTFETNIMGTWNLLESCRRNSLVKQIVVASSDKAYGSHDTLPYREDTPLCGRFPYDVSKSASDVIAQSYACTYKLPLVITRCGNFYGGGDLNWNRLVPGTIRSILRGQSPVIRSDGKCVRDFLYVEDGVAGYIQLVERISLDPLICGQAFNLSTENRLNVMEVVDKILGLMDSHLSVQILDETHSEIRNQYLSAEKARALLGWTPAFPIDEGLRRTIQWYRKFFGESI